MKNSSIARYTRKIDELGRVVLPVELREKAHIPANGSVNILFNDGKIIIENEKAYCIICKSSENIKASISICQKCIEQIKNDEI